MIEIETFESDEFDFCVEREQLLEDMLLAYVKQQNRGNNDNS